MAEAAGLVLGAVSLSSLFSSCVELAEYISVARNVGADYEATYTKLLLLKSRLISSGSRLTSIVQEQNVRATGDSFGENEHTAAARSLIAIKGLLENAQELEQKYGLRQEGDGGHHQLVELQKCHSSTLQEVEHVLQASVQRRQQKTQLGRRIVWAIRDKKAFDGLISNLAFHINELENLVLRSGSQTYETMLPSLPSNLSPMALELLNSAASGPDMNRHSTDATVYDQTSGNAVSGGHLYLRNQIKDRARVLQGDVGGNRSIRGPRHTFAENSVSGDAKVIQGDAYNGFMDDFWKD